MTTHRPVLLKEVIDYLAPRAGGRYLDGTVGSGGHARAILAAAPSGEVLGLDRDPAALHRLAATDLANEPRLHLEQAAYRQAPDVLERLGWLAVEGALLDLGFSSDQLDDSSRGMSFRFEAPLDLRFDQTTGRPAASLIATWSEHELATILENYGELNRGRALATRIKNFGPIRTTTELQAASGLAHPRRLAQLFQAIRLATNDELRELEQGLAAIWPVIEPGGRLVVISFHSLEDRLVKRFFQSLAHAGDGQPLTKKVVVASLAEQRQNPRARSAKLRAIEKSHG